MVAKITIEELKLKIKDARENVKIAKKQLKDPKNINTEKKHEKCQKKLETKERKLSKLLEKLPKKRPMKGGNDIHLVGEGSNGCVVQILDKLYKIIKSVKKTSGSKTVQSDETKVKENITIKDDSIDLDNYFIFPELVKNIEPNIKNYMRVCNKHTYTNTNKYIVLEMVDGGTSMNKHIREFSLFEWVLTLKHLLTAIKILLDNSLVHLDIRLDNIVMKQDEMPRIIDFGLLSSFDLKSTPAGVPHIGDTLSSLSSGNIFDIDKFFPHIPLEVFLNILQIGCSQNKGVDAIDDNVYVKNIYTKTVKRIANGLTPLHNYKIIQNIDKQLDIPLLDYTKIDIYSLGICCIMHHRNINFEDDNTIINAPYFEMVNGMTEINANERWDVEKAIEKCVEIEKLYTKETTRRRSKRRRQGSTTRN